MRVIARAALAPLHAQPTLSSEQVSQLVLGETAHVEESAGEWRRVTGDQDDYPGWVHAGYVVEADDESAARWRDEARGWSLGAVLRAGDLRVTLPLRARVALANGAVRLPDGRAGRLVEGGVADVRETVAEARGKAPERWALEHFAGAPYEWGGVTPWGVDCSGLVQTTFAARCLALPRDSSVQVDRGAPVAPDQIRPGDLLFFRGENSRRITHVALAGESDTLIHSTVSCGGVLVESWLPGTRAGALRERLEAARRLEER